jgi:hypothetical protein
MSSLLTPESNFLFSKVSPGKLKTRIVDAVVNEIFMTPLVTGFGYNFTTATPVEQLTDLL